jgi:hypothetical protein
MLQYHRMDLVVLKFVDCLKRLFVILGIDLRVKYRHDSTEEYHEILKSG